MMTMVNSFMLIMTMIVIFNENPMKICVALIVMSSLLFMSMFLKMGFSWFSLIMCMLFTGGILVMFMIVSSISPNKKNNKMKMIYTSSTVLLLVVVPVMLTWDEESFSVTKSLKWFFEEKQTITATVMMMMTYFISFMTILNKSNMSMRTTMCQYKENFVNYLKENWQ